MAGLTRLKIEGFKSIRSAELELRPLNVLIGANGSGKSNLVSFFRLLRAIGDRRLQMTVAEWGGAGSILHYGPKDTPDMSFVLASIVRGQTLTYSAVLHHVSEDWLRFSFHGVALEQGGETAWRHHFTPALEATYLDGRWKAPAGVRPALRRMTAPACFHFNDTSPRSGIRLTTRLAERAQLLPGGDNLASYLYMLREEHAPYYQRIVDTIRLAAPFLDDFVLEPSGANKEYIMLYWRDRARGETFGPHQLSDGTLRFIALATLLLQPEDRLPKLIVIDEPELGLHPFALNVLAGLLRSASLDSQIIVATQSARLVDEFGPEDIIVADHHDGASEFRRLNPEDLSMWLDDYSLGELWEKNVIGGRPSR